MGKKEMTKTDKPTTSASPVDRLVMLLKGNWRYVNYNKEFPHAQCWKSWKPAINKYWMGDIWEFSFRAHAVSVDMRTNWIADMVDPNRPDRHKV